MPKSEPPDIPGVDQVIAWFGRWPSFHDAEVIALTLNRIEPSVLQVLVFNYTAVTDDKSSYTSEKHAIVHFTFAEITETQLFNFNHQNVVFGIDVQVVEDIYEVRLHPCYGLNGSIFGKGLSLQVEPGLPGRNVYL